MFPWEFLSPAIKPEKNILNVEFFPARTVGTWYSDMCCLRMLFHELEEDHQPH
jgi:hypothetical protein